MPAKPHRTIFFVSDGTGITVEMLGHSLLTQFEGIDFDQMTVPFIDSVAKAAACVARINLADLLLQAGEMNAAREQAEIAFKLAPEERRARELWEKARRPSKP